MTIRIKERIQLEIQTIIIINQFKEKIQHLIKIMEMQEQTNTRITNMGTIKIISMDINSSRIMEPHIKNNLL